jgi:hypothetical protein
MFRTLRIAILLFILVNVALGAWLARARTTSWERPLRVMVFPINADGSQATATYIAGLKRETFRPIGDFLRDEAKRWGMASEGGAQFYLAPQMHALPPAPPYGGSVPQIMVWSLHLRYWAWRNADYGGQPRPEVRLFVVYHDPARVERVAHSLGLQKGLIGVVHAFASAEQEPENNVVLAHELLHTLGATDKYDPGSNQPAFPDGYAEPEKVPRLPQEFAEIMAGRIPLSASEADIPHGLHQVVVGGKTAREINWLQ